MSPFSRKSFDDFLECVAEHFYQANKEQKEDCRSNEDELSEIKDFIGTAERHLNAP
jgi:hypothetical protein